MNNDTFSDLDQQAFFEISDQDFSDSIEENSEDDCLAEERARVLDEEYLESKMPPGFYFEEDKLMFDPKSDKNENSKSPIFVCSKLLVKAITRDREGNNQGRLLEFKDLDGIKKQWAMPMALLARDGGEYRAELLSLGHLIGSHKSSKSLLAIYIQTAIPVERAVCVESTGWHRNCFVLPDKVYGASKERIILQRGTSSVNVYSQGGNLFDWQKNVSNYCRGNSRLIFAISIGFAPPFLELLGMEGGGVHYFGSSSIGKTTASRVACSVWGSKEYLQPWRATVNGLEAVASLHNDTLLCLDEISQCDPMKVGEIAYLLANGLGKNRANQFGNSRKNLKWRLYFLSNGELTIEQYLHEVAKKKRGGQEVRMIEIPAQTGVFGLFEKLHGFSNGKSLSEALEKNCQSFFGIAGRELISRLVSDSNKWKILALDLFKEFVKQNMPKGADGQVGRVLNRFGLVAAAGEIATKMGITGWLEGESFQAAIKCFHDWLSYRGGIGSQEERKILSLLYLFFQKYGESRFTGWETAHEEKTAIRAGYWKKECGEINYFVYPEFFREEICVGFDPQLVAKIAIKHGLLKPDSEGKPTRGEKLPGNHKTIRCYRFTSKVLGGDEEYNHNSASNENSEIVNRGSMKNQ